MLRDFNWTEKYEEPMSDEHPHYVKNIFPNMLSNTFLDFISDTGVTDHGHYDR